MDAIWYGIADVCKAIFKFLPSIGALVNWFFGIAIAVGTAYWLWYDRQAKTTETNYMANKGGQ